MLYETGAIKTHRHCGANTKFVHDALSLDVSSQANEGSASPRVDLPVRHIFHPISARAASFVRAPCLRRVRFSPFIYFRVRGPRGHGGKVMIG